MALVGVRQQLQAIAVSGDYFTDAPDQVSVWSEAAAREKQFKLRNQVVELTHQSGNFVYRMADICHAHLTPELSRSALRRRVWFNSENLARRREAVSA